MLAQLYYPSRYFVVSILSAKDDDQRTLTTSPAAIEVLVVNFGLDGEEYVE